MITFPTSQIQNVDVAGSGVSSSTFTTFPLQLRCSGAALALVDAAASRMRATIHISLGPALVAEKIQQVFFAKLY